MQKLKLLIFLAIFFIILIVFINFNRELIDFLITINLENTKLFYYYLVVSSIYFISPLPITLIILINGFIFKDYGFYISMFQILVGSFSLNLFSNKINKVFNFYKYYEKQISKFKKFNLKKISENNYSIFLSRFILPYFIHNIFFAVIKIKIYRFLFLIFFAEIPMTYALSSIGATLNKISFDQSVSAYNLFTDINFYVPFILIFVIFVVIDKLNFLFK